MNREERKQLGCSRLIRNLERLVVANWRTLEQKVSDAGPNPMRVNPHILTESKSALLNQGRIIQVNPNRRVDWYHLREAPDSEVQRRLDELIPIQAALSHAHTARRIGQTLEIAFYLAARECPDFLLFGSFDLSQRKGRAQLFTKEEPPSSISNRSITGSEKLDFVIHHPQAGLAGVEIKNIREWMYPNRPEVREMLRKCILLDAVPVFIARRIHFSTFLVLSRCGVIVRETYNQLYADIDEELAELAKHKDKLGYHDIRIGHEPDRRLLKFAREDLAAVLPKARNTFQEYKDLLEDYAFGRIDYKSFAARVGRRFRGEPEDFDQGQERPDDDFFG